MTTRTLTEWAETIGRTNERNDWHTSDLDDPAQAIARLALITTEVAEAIEEIRDGHGITETYHSSAKPEGVPSELADVIIRALDLAWEAGIDIEAHVAEKVTYNAGRGHRHGGKTA